MKRFFFIISIAICFIGFIFLLTAARSSSSGGGKNNQSGSGNSTTQVVRRIMQFKFGSHTYRCAGNTNPLVGAYLLRNRTLVVSITGIQSPNFMTHYRGSEIYRRYVYAPCFPEVEVPKNQHYLLTIFYHEPLPCDDYNAHTCERWYYQDQRYSGNYDVGCPEDCNNCVYVNQMNPKNPVGRCNDYSIN